MTAFASKVWAGRRHPRWWIVVLAAVTAMAFAAGVSARAEAAAVEWTPYSGSDQVTDDGCGYPIAVAVTLVGGSAFGLGPARTPGISSSLTTTPRAGRGRRTESHTPCRTPSIRAYLQ